MTITLKGVAETMRKLSRLEQRGIRRVVTAASRAGGKELLKLARSYAPSRTGMLRKQLRQSIKNDRRTGTVTSTIWPKPTKSQRRKGHQPRGSIMHLIVGGVRPHVIPGPVSVNGRVRRNVQHPGHAANQFMEHAAISGYTPSVRAFTDRFKNKLDEEIQKART